MRDIADIIFSFALFGKLLGDVFACAALSTEREIGYNGFSTQAAPIYDCGESYCSQLVYGLSTLFVVHVVLRPPAMLVIDQAGFSIAASVLALNLTVGYVFAGAYLFNWVKS